jgi:uncharacterized RDD family membrane protein YckC
MTDQPPERPSEQPQQDVGPPAPRPAPPAQDTYWSDSAPPVYGAPAPPDPNAPPAPGNPYAPPTPANPYAPAPAQPVGPGSLASVEASFGRVATFGDRVLAHLIDLGITLSGLILVFLGAIVLAFGSRSWVTLENGTTAAAAADPVLTAVGVMFLVIGFGAMLGLWLWNRVFRMGRTGQSIGKSSQGLMLIDTVTGRPIGAGSSFLREIVAGLVNQVVYLSYLWMLWDPDRQTVADKAVHSTVIHVPKDGAPSRPVFTA